MPVVALLGTGELTGFTTGPRTNLPSAPAASTPTCRHAHQVGQQKGSMEFGASENVAGRQDLMAWISGPSLGDPRALMAPPGPDIAQAVWERPGAICNTNDLLPSTALRLARPWAPQVNLSQDPIPMSVARRKSPLVATGCPHLWP